MADFTRPDTLLLISFVVQIAAAFVLVLPDQKRAAGGSVVLLLAGVGLGFIASGAILIDGRGVAATLPLMHGLVRLDGLSTYFLAITQLVAIPTTIYLISFLGRELESGKSIRGFLFFYILLLISTQIVVIANHSIVFLVAWETMSMSGYFAMIYDHDQEEVQKGSFYYFAAAHVLIFFLYVAFFLLHLQTGSWLFSDYHLPFSTSAAGPLIFILSFIGFGMKAGFMPFHFWLPRAHPIAPTVISAFLSGVMIKMGIYGILRTYLFLRPVPEWTGWFVLVISMISAILGVWYALAQHDIKRLLAYHSIENIGIIGIGIGIGFIGSAHHLPAVEILGFGGALLHTLNHSLFKSLLFLGSGTVVHELGTRNIELMGGLIHRARYFVLLFLIGSVAISGIPPLNGFVSEFIIYLGFFRTANALGHYYPIIMLMFVVGLAFMGGLAVACFTKINSIMFLGTSRTPEKKFHVSLSEYLSLGIFASLCVTIGFYPQPFIGVVNSVLSDGFLDGATSALAFAGWQYFTLIFAVIVFGGAGLFIVKIGLERKFGSRSSQPWACGYEPLTSRMQYTASSFADELNSIPKSVLGYTKSVEVSDSVFPMRSEFRSRSADFIDARVLRPSYRLMGSLARGIDLLSKADLRYSVAFMMITLVLSIVLAYLWH